MIADGDFSYPDSTCTTGAWTGTASVDSTEYYLGTTGGNEAILPSEQKPDTRTRLAWLAVVWEFLADNGIIGTTKLVRLPSADFGSRKRPERKARSPP